MGDPGPVGGGQETWPLEGKLEKSGRVRQQLWSHVKWTPDKHKTNELSFLLQYTVVGVEGV